jgi:hypothetical protein
MLAIHTRVLISEESVRMEPLDFIDTARALLQQNAPGYRLHVAYRDSFSWDEWPGLWTACQELARECGYTLSANGDPGCWVLEK